MHGARQARRIETAEVSEIMNRAVRASDLDRERVVEMLGEHAAAGRLTLSEFEDRASAAYRASYVSDLDQLFADLPTARVSRPRSEVVRRSEGIVGLRWPHRAWGPWAMTAMICMLIWALTSIGQGEWLYVWPIWVIGPWGVAMFCGLRAGWSRAGSPRR